MSTPPTIGYITIYNAAADAKPSELPGMRGGGYNLAQALIRRGNNIDYFGPLTSDVSLLAKLRWRFEQRVLNRSWFVWLDPKLLNSFANQIEKRIQASSAQTLLCPQNFWPIARLKTHLPIVLYTDAPLGALLDMPGYFGKVSTSTRNRVLNLEGQALSNCTTLVFPSRWAADRACELYGIPTKKTYVVPYGGNLPSVPIREEVIANCESRTRERCELLYVGLGWRRKGLLTAIALAQYLNNNGLPVRLTVVGDTPKGFETPPYVRCLGIIDRTTAEGWQQFVALFSASHFFLLPTVADISPFVLCEANAFGLPCLATRIGGIPTIVKEGANGLVVDIDEKIVPNFAKFILQKWSDPTAYQSLCRSSLEEFHTRLNWDSAAGEIERIIAATVFQ